MPPRNVLFVWKNAWTCENGKGPEWVSSSLSSTTTGLAVDWLWIDTISWPGASDNDLLNGGVVASAGAALAPLRVPSQPASSEPIIIITHPSQCFYKRAPGLQQQGHYLLRSFFFVIIQCVFQGEPR